MSATLEWFGDELIAKLQKAEVAGLTETALNIAVEYASRVHVLSGDLRDSAQVLDDPQSTGGGYEVYIGSELDYAAIQEQGPADGRAYAYQPALRPAKDIHAPGLTGEIAKGLG